METRKLVTILGCNPVMAILDSMGNTLVVFKTRKGIIDRMTKWMRENNVCVPKSTALTYPWMKEFAYRS